jgi:hypothetical protein
MKLPFALGLVVMLAAPAARADIFKCVEEGGHVTYTNTKASGKGCSVLSRDQPISSMPAASTPRPSGAAAPAGNGAAAGASGFPRIEPGTQKTRDNDRRRILEEELATEQRALDDAKKELAEQEGQRSGDERNYQRVLDRLQPYKDRVQLHERNIDALHREIANLR